MSYSTVATIAEDPALTRRVQAAAAEERVPDLYGWIYRNIWLVASQPGWDEAWESAVAGGVENPGADPGVITDGMILSGVQEVIGEQTPPAGDI